MSAPLPVPKIRFAETAADFDAVRALSRNTPANWGWICVSRIFQQESDGLPGDYDASRGASLLAEVDDAWAGCCALRPLDTADYPNAAEMKRLFVKPGHRGLGIGRLLAEAIMDAARARGYDCILLDTLDDMETARALYAELGFEEVPPYYFNPIAGAHYLKAEL